MRLAGNLYDIEQAGPAEALVRLNAGHEIYRAHFPGSPITPGVCLIQMAVEICATLEGKEFIVREVRDAKFFSPAVPEVCPRLRFAYETGAAGEGLVKISTCVSDAGGGRVARIIVLAEMNEL